MKNAKNKDKKIEIYKSRGKETSVEVTFEKETVWINQYQLSEILVSEQFEMVCGLISCFSGRKYQEFTYL